MKKSGVISILVISIIILLSFNFISAGWYSDVMSQITGNSITGMVVEPIPGNNSASIITTTGPTECYYNEPCGPFTVSSDITLTYWYQFWVNKVYANGTSARQLVTPDAKGWAPSAQTTKDYSFSFTITDTQATKVRIWTRAYKSSTYTVWTPAGNGYEIAMKVKPVDNINNTTSICTDFVYSSWSACNFSGIQTREVLNSYPLSCSGGSPILTQSCNPAQNCIDSDEGMDIYEGGIISGIGANLMDSCTSTNQITEYICDTSNNIRVTNASCENGCTTFGGMGYCEPAKTGTCEDKTIDIINFKHEGEADKITLRQKDSNSNWVTICSDKSEGTICSTGNFDITIGKIDYVAKTAYLSMPNNYYFINFCNERYSGNIIKVDANICDQYFIESCANPFNLNTLSSCSELSSFIQNPKDFVAQDSTWKLNYNYSWTSSYSSMKNYYSGFSKENGNNYISINMNEVSGSEKETLINQLNSNINYQLCSKKSINNQEVYVCLNPWSVAYESKDLNNIGSDTSKSVIWLSGNKLFEIWISDYNNDYWTCWDEASCNQRQEYINQRKQENLVKAFSNLIDNQPKYIGNYDLDWNTELIVKELLRLCNSEKVESEESLCDSGWSCKIEPVICPPHGSQKQNCIQYCNGKENVRTSEIQCSPGICSGCYVPRWFGYNVADNKCIPYGFRLQSQIGEITEIETREDKELLYEQSNGDYSLTINSENDATLILGGNNYSLRVGETTEVKMESRIYLITVNSIHVSTSTEDKGYIETTIKYDYENRVIQTMNGYCDIDGKIKEQKTANGEVAKCQNNYECDSNVCSSGECIDLKNAISQVNGLKAFFVKMICKISNPLSTDNYNQCVYDYLGEVPAATA